MTSENRTSVADLPEDFIASLGETLTQRDDELINQKIIHDLEGEWKLAMRWSQVCAVAGDIDGEARNKAEAERFALLLYVAKTGKKLTKTEQVGVPD